MSAEITHDADGTQLVTPTKLRAILDEEGSDYMPPLPYTGNQQWDVAGTKIAVCECMYPLTVDEHAEWPDECPSCEREITVDDDGTVTIDDD